MITLIQKILDRPVEVSQDIPVIVTMRIYEDQIVKLESDRFGDERFRNAAGPGGALDYNMWTADPIPMWLTDDTTLMWR
jgi:hypothetical protein